MYFYLIQVIVQKSQEKWTVQLTYFVTNKKAFLPQPLDFKHTLEIISKRFNVTFLLQPHHIDSTLQITVALGSNIFLFFTETAFTHSDFYNFVTLSQCIYLLPLKLQKTKAVQEVRHQINQFESQPGISPQINL